MYAVISTAPSMCTSTSTIGRSVKYCTKPIGALGELDDEQVARGPADPVRRVGRVQRDQQRDGQPDQQEHQVGVQLADLLAGRGRCAPAFGSPLCGPLPVTTVPTHQDGGR